MPLNPPNSTKTLAVVGAGLIGRLTAWTLSAQGHRVHLYDRDTRQGTDSCGFVGAGMLAPVSELESAEHEISWLGKASLALWPEILRRLPLPVFFQQAGTLVVAHAQDWPDWERFRHKVGRADPKALQEVAGTSLTALEPALANRFRKGLYLPGEGQLENRHLMAALALGLQQQGCVWHEQTAIDEVMPGRLTVDGKALSFDWVIDCRGLGAKAQLPDLRGVRGEIIRVAAPEVILNRPVRLIHPRYPLYVAPRPEGQFVIGATVIESEAMDPVTVQSALELLSAAFSLHAGFAEATILEMRSHCRPAFPDHLPRLLHEPGLIRVNGLYRHGFLISPKLVQWTSRLVGEPADSELQNDTEQTLFQRVCKESAGYAACH